MLKYIVPFYYLIHSRTKGIHFLSYFLMNILPPFLLLLLYYKETISFVLLQKYILSFLAMLSLYEAGYIVNDSICILKDPKPTRRIDFGEEIFIKSRIKRILLLKTMCSALFFILLCLTCPFYSMLRLAACLVLILFIYAIHNTFRSWINYITVFFLTTLNYVSTIAVFGSFMQWISALLIIMLIFSLPKTALYIIRKKSEHYREGFSYAFYMFAMSMVLSKTQVWIIPFYIALYRSLNFILWRKR